MKTIDQETQILLQAFKDNGSSGIESYSPLEARKIYAQNSEGYLDPIEIETVYDESIKTRDDSEIKIRIYDPRQKITDGSKSPAIIFIHGGGWVIGNLETHDAICRLVAKETQYPVIAIDYRLAPEYPFPYALHDCLDALLAVVAKEVTLNINPHDLIVMGDSAGGNLATVIAHQFNEEDHYQITQEVLFYPVTTMAADTSSYQRFATGYPLSAETMYWFIDHYITHHDDRMNPSLSPLYYENLDAHMRSFILTVGIDPLCDEGIDYARKLIVNGNYVEYHHQPDTIHGILTAAKIVNLGKEYIIKSCQFIRRFRDEV